MAAGQAVWGHGQDGGDARIAPGDLTARAAIGNGAAKTESDRIDRLVRRGFLTARGNDDGAITALVGRVALVIKHGALR